MKSRISMWTTVVYLLAALAMPVCMAAQDSPSQDSHNKHHKYKLIILGTFGGPQSYLTAGTLTPSGTVTGWADTSVPDPYAPNCFNPDCFVSHTFTWRNGVMNDLGALAGANSSAPNSETANGLTAGISENGVIDPLIGFPEVRAVFWRDGRIINLGTLGGNESFATSLNTRGQVVGVSANSTADEFSGFWFGWGTQTRAFLWQNGVMQDLGTLGGPDALAGAINERGQIAGQSYTNSIPNDTTGQPTLDAFLWERGRMVDVGTLGGTMTFSSGLNNRGQITGQSNLPGDVTFHPFLWDNGRLTDLGTLGGDTGTPNGITETGEIFGKADLPGSQAHHGFLWRNGRMIDLGTLGSDPCSNAWSINSKEQIVGNTSLCVVGLHGFLWENGGPMVDVNSLLESHSDFMINNALGINDRGEISGLGVFPNGEGHAYVLIPCDENHPGSCDDNSMIEVSPQQTTVRAGQFHNPVYERSELPVTLERERPHLSRSNSRNTGPASRD